MKMTGFPVPCTWTVKLWNWVCPCSKPEKAKETRRRMRRSAMHEFEEELAVVMPFA
jgi:hypothetical protein